MTRFTKKCPYCGRVIKTEYAIQERRLGNPIVRCRYCLNSYIDRNVYDWVISPLWRKIGYCFANYRALICFLPQILAALYIVKKYNQPLERAFLICTPVFLCMFLFCALYVKHEIKYEIRNSYNRISNIEYLKTLKQAKYPMKRKIKIYAKDNKKSKNNLTANQYKKYQDGLFTNHQSKNK